MTVEERALLRLIKERHDEVHEALREHDEMLADQVSSLVGKVDLPLYDDEAEALLEGWETHNG